MDRRAATGAEAASAYGSAVSTTRAGRVAPIARGRDAHHVGGPCLPAWGQRSRRRLAGAIALWWVNTTVRVGDEDGESDVRVHEHADGTLGQHEAPALPGLGCDVVATIRP